MIIALSLPFSLSLSLPLSLSLLSENMASFEVDMLLSEAAVGEKIHLTLQYNPSGTLIKYNHLLVNTSHDYYYSCISGPVIINY